MQISIIRNIHKYNLQGDPVNKATIKNVIEKQLDEHIRQGKNFDSLFRYIKVLTGIPYSILDNSNLMELLNSIANKKLNALKESTEMDNIVVLSRSLLNFVNAYREDNKELLSDIKEAMLDSIKKADKPFDKLALFNDLRKFVNQKGLDANISDIIQQIKKQIQGVQTNKPHTIVQGKHLIAILEEILNESAPLKSFLKPEGASGKQAPRSVNRFD